MITQLPITIRYAETDAMRVVHHSSYVVWLEAARVEWLREMGLPYHELEARGFNFSVIDLCLKYKASARFGDEVIVKVCLKEFGSRGLSFVYQVLKGEQVLVDAETKHLCQTPEGKVMRIPSEILLRLESAVK